jgi:hypothetical protein
MNVMYNGEEYVKIIKIHIKTVFFFEFHIVMYTYQNTTTANCVLIFIFNK